MLLDERLAKGNGRVIRQNPGIMAIARVYSRQYLAEAKQINITLAKTREV